nr:thiamine pyrophosphokinase 1 isoform X1 [Ipomoea batatas]
MTHSSSFLLPIPPADDNGPALTYALVVLNQSLPRFTPLLWKAAQLHVCADGGANRVYDELPHVFPHEDASDVRKRYKPDVIKGDMDSIRSEVRDFYTGLKLPEQRKPRKLWDVRTEHNQERVAAGISSAEKWAPVGPETRIARRINAEGLGLGAEKGTPEKARVVPRLAHTNSEPGYVLWWQVSFQSSLLDRCSVGAVQLGNLGYILKRPRGAYLFVKLDVLGLWFKLFDLCGYEQDEERMILLFEKGKCKFCFNLAYGPVLLQSGMVPVPNWSSAGPFAQSLSPGAQPSNGLASVYGIFTDGLSFFNRLSQDVILLLLAFPLVLQVSHPPGWNSMQINIASSPLGLPLRPLLGVLPFSCLVPISLPKLPSGFVRWTFKIPFVIITNDSSSSGMGFSPGKN